MLVLKIDLESFARALESTPENHEDLISAESDWRPIRQRIRGKKKRRHRTDETREGFVYTILKWPLLIGILGWLLALSISYLLTRFYIFELFSRLICCCPGLVEHPVLQG